MSKEEQAKRIDARRQNPLKCAELLSVDEKAQEMWIRTRFKEEMFSKTHTTFSPWIIVKANDKQAACLEGLRYVLNLPPYRGKDEAQIRLTPDPNVITRFHREDGGNWISESGQVRGRSRCVSEGEGYGVMWRSPAVSAMLLVALLGGSSVACGRPGMMSCVASRPGGQAGGSWA
ncbi:MAG: hypothetical protein R3B08_01525 [Nitrospira sp.]